MNIKESNLTDVGYLPQSVSEMLNENKNLITVLDGLGDIFNDLTVDSRMGSVAVSNNTSTSFSREVDEALKNPLENMFGIYKHAGSFLKSLVNEAAVEYLKSNKSIIKKAVKAYGNDLIYTIILNEDSVKNRAKLLTFVNDYRETEVSQKFNIIFNFLPQDLEDFIREKHEVVC